MEFTEIENFMDFYGIPEMALGRPLGGPLGRPLTWPAGARPLGRPLGRSAVQWAARPLGRPRGPLLGATSPLLIGAEFRL